MLIRRAVSLAGALAVAAGLTVSTAVAATAGTSSTPPTDTCTFYAGHLGPWGVTKSYSRRNLAWTSGTHSGNSVALENYGDHLSQCWKFLGGFGNGEFELKLANSGVCVAVQGASRAVNARITMYPCVSKTRELFQEFTKSNKSQFRNVNSGLCIEVKGGPAKGHVLIQARCSNYGVWQSWLLAHP